MHSILDISICYSCLQTFSEKAIVDDSFNDKKGAKEQVAIFYKHFYNIKI